jgi:protein ImuB
MFAALHFPEFTLQAAIRHEPELWARPVALMDGMSPAPRVIEATAAARAAGVDNGLTAPQALARCRALLIRQRDPARESATQDAVLQCAFGFSPNIEATAPGLVTMDLRGLSEFVSPGAEPGPPRLVQWGERVAGAMGRLGLRVRTGIGATPNVARHAACWAAESSIPHGRGTGPAVGGVQGSGVVVVRDCTGFVAGLPVAALGPSSDVAAILRDWGIRSVGELLALGQAELAERLGLEALALFAAASVTSTRPLRLVRPAEHFEEAHELEVEIEMLEPLLFLVRRFVDCLSQRLAAVGLVAGALILKLRLESGEVLERALRVPQPTCRADLLFRMLHTFLETVRARSAIRAVCLTAEPARPEQRQFHLFEAALRDPHQFHDTLARLAGLVGSDRVGSPRREDSHRPDAFTLVPPAFEEPVPPTVRSVPELIRPLPIRRFRPALKAELNAGLAPSSMAGAGPHLEGDRSAARPRPLSLRCALGSARIDVASGPWKATGHWWDEAHWEREEWDVATSEGMVLRVVLQRGEWQVDGVLD